MALRPRPCRRPAPLLLPLAVAALLACDGSTAPAEEPPKPAAPIARTAFGLPGPWWRAGASNEAFEADVRGCRAVSTRARREATGGDALDAAYRAFLGCMEGSGWRRGSPPASLAAPPPAAPGD